MKFSLKTLAAAVALAAAAGSASAAIDNGALGNGELFFNLSSTSGSYTRDLGYTIGAFNDAVAAAGNINLSWAADTALNDWLSAQSGPVEMNIFATDITGARRIITSLGDPLPASGIKNDVVRTAAGNISVFANEVNKVIGSTDSATFVNGDAGYAGKVVNGKVFNDKIYNVLNFNTTKDTFANGVLIPGAAMQMVLIDALATGIANSIYTPYIDNGNKVNMFFDANNNFHIQAVPEPSEYALLLAGLGLMGVVARHRSQKQA